MQAVSTSEESWLTYDVAEQKKIARPLVFDAFSQTE